MNKTMLDNLKSPVLLAGTASCCYKDPAILYHGGVFYLYYSYTEIEEDGTVFMYVGESTSRNLADWTPVRILTPRDRSLNYSSPGNVFYYKDRWVMSFQTYCRENGEHYGNQNSRVYIMESYDLVSWGSPRLLKVKGPGVDFDDIGRMIDPYILEDKDEPGKWWCFYKQNGVSMSWSHDLEHWNYKGHTESGENVCALVKDGEYYLFHAPDNGIALQKSRDLVVWEPVVDMEVLNQKNWPWTQGRITAACVLDGREIEGLGCYLMVFHGHPRRFDGNGERMDDNYASLGIAWSHDLINWFWPEGGEHFQEFITG